MKPRYKIVRASFGDSMSISQETSNRADAQFLGDMDALTLRHILRNGLRPGMAFEITVRANKRGKITYRNKITL